MGLNSLGGRYHTVVITILVASLMLPFALHHPASGGITYDDATIEWHLETIDDSNDSLPGKTSIAVDQEGGVHVSYHDDIMDSLRYAHRDKNGTWSRQMIDAPGMGNNSSIAVDAQGKVHIAYEDHGNGSLKHAVRSISGEWTIGVVDHGPRSGGYPTMVIDGNDNVVIAYLDHATPSIKLAIQDGASWSISDIVIAEHLYWGEIDLAISDNGSMYIVYLAGDRHPRYLQAYYAYRWRGENWRQETEPFVESAVMHLSMALGYYELPSVVVRGGNMLYEKIPNGRWVYYEYYEDQEFRDYGNIVYDSHGERVVCGQTASGSLRYVLVTPLYFTRAGVVDDRAGTGLYASMTVDDHDFLHIVYYDGTEGRLVYATDITRPSEPLNVTATGGERDIHVEWDIPTYLGNSTSVTYNIYRDHVSRRLYDLYVSGLTNTSFLDTEVDNRVYYHYWVVAVNGAGEGHISKMAYDRAFLHPTTPQNITATAGPDNVVLRWEPPEDPGVYTVTGYRIQWRSGTTWSGMGPEWQYYPLSEWSNITVDGLTLSYNHTGLLHGYTYHYQIAALHTGGEGELSEDVKAIPMVPPSMPVNLTAYRSAGRVIINWTPSIDDGGCRLTAYMVYRGTTPFDLQLLTQINGSAGDWNLWRWPAKRLVDDGTVPEFLNDRYLSDDWNYTHPKDEYDEPGKLDDGKTYYYQVSAVHLAGEGPRSEVLEVPPSSNRPQRIRVKEVEGGVQISWEPPVTDGANGVLGYVIYRSASDGEAVRVTQVDWDERSYVDVDIEFNTTYTYYVRGVTDEGEGMSSDHVEITVGEGVSADGSSGGIDDVVPLLAVLVLLVCLSLAFIVLRKRAERGS